MNERIIYDIKQALSRIDNHLETPSQKRQALDCVKKVVENPPAKVAPPKKSVGRPASEIRQIFNESKKAVVGKRGPQSVQFAVDLLDKRIKWIEEKLGESVSYDDIKKYFKPELARIESGLAKEKGSPLKLAEEKPSKPKPEPKPEPKKKPKGRPITSGKSRQPIEREAMEAEDPKIKSDKQRKKERESMEEEDPQRIERKIRWRERDQMKAEDPKPRDSVWATESGRARDKAQRDLVNIADKAKMAKARKTRAKKDEAQKELEKIAKQAQAQAKKAEREEKKAKEKAEKEAKKAEKEAKKAEKEAKKAKTAKEKLDEADRARRASEDAKRKADKAREEAEAKAKKAKEEAEEELEKLDDAETEAMMAELKAKIAKAEAEEKDKKFKSTYTNTIPWNILKPLGITKKIPEEWRKGIVKDENGLVAEIKDVEAKKKGFIRTKFVFTLEKKNGDKKEFEVKIEYEPDSKVAAIIEDELEYDITDDEEEPEQEEIEEQVDEEEFLVRADEQPSPYAKMAVQESRQHKGDKKYFRDKIKDSNGLIEEYLTYEELNEYPRVYKDEIEAAETLPVIEDFVMFPIYKKKKKGSGRMLGRGKKYRDNIMETKKRQDGLVKEVKKVVQKGNPVVVVNEFNKNDFGVVKGNVETQEMPINRPDVSNVPLLKNKGKIGKAPLQSNYRYEGAGNAVHLRHRGFHTQNTKEFLESRYM